MRAVHLNTSWTVDICTCSLVQHFFKSLARVCSRREVRTTNRCTVHSIMNTWVFPDRAHYPVLNVIEAQSPPVNRHHLGLPRPCKRIQPEFDVLDRRDGIVRRNDLDSFRIVQIGPEGELFCYC